MRIAIALALAIAAVVQSRQPSLAEVIRRVERYVEGYEPALSTLVARERYTQALKGLGGAGQESRTVVSDFLFLRLPGRDGPWLGFRDVFEVDGRALERHEERLRDIVAASPADAARRSYEMMRESARYNIGPIARTVNVPVCVLGWMHARLRDHFSFSRVREERLDSATAWVIAFRERQRPTIVRNGGRDIESFGHVWVDPTDGRILRTEQENVRGTLHVRIRVEFAANPELGILVPSKMTEEYVDDPGALETDAVYSNYRRFGVTTLIK